MPYLKNNMKDSETKYFSGGTNGCKLVWQLDKAFQKHLLDLRSRQMENKLVVFNEVQ